MSTKVEQTQADTNLDGIVDYWNTKVSYFTADKLTTTEITTQYTDGSRSASREDLAYDDAGRVIAKTLHSDPEGDGTFGVSTVEQAWTVNGQLEKIITTSADLSGDGVGGDVIMIEGFTYNAAGLMTAKDTDWIVNGAQSPIDYVDERWEYNSKGQVTMYSIDDPSFFDTVITKFYTYKYDNLINIKVQDDIRFNDDRPRIDQSFTYNKDGSIKTSTDWAQWSDQGWMQRVDHEFTYRSGYQSEKVKYDLEGDFKPEAIKLIEHWYNGAGQETHTLTSLDSGADGGPLAGGFDSRSLVVQTWNGSELAKIEKDFDANGVFDETTVFSWTGEALLA